MSKKRRSTARTDDAPPAASAAAPAVDVQTVVEALAGAPCFGAAFFVKQLASLLREHCPEPAECLPRVLLHLDRGDVLDVCHVIALAPRWVALAVFDEDDRMSTELVPYATMTRIRICTPREGAATSRAIGFHQDRSPTVIGDTHEGERPRS